MLIGYARVSKADGSQNLDLQKDALIKAGVDSGRIYHDYASSRKDNRPGLQSCIKALQPGNILVVWKLDRLGRDIKDLISMVDMLGKKEVGFSDKNNLTYTKKMIDLMTKLQGAMCN